MYNAESTIYVITLNFLINDKSSNEVHSVTLILYEGIRCHNLYS